MSNTEKDPSGAPDPSAGGEGDPEPKQTVSYETHQRLLSEKKREQEKARNAEAELQTLRQEKLDREKKELESQGKWKELADAKQKEADELKAENQQIKSDLNNARKKSALLKAITGTVPVTAHSLLPLDLVTIGEDGKVDEQSAKLAAQAFEKDHSYAVLRDKAGGGLPNNAAKPDGMKLTVEEWEMLPLKEMKAKIDNVDWNTAKK